MPYTSEMFPTDCVLCDYAGDTHEEYEQHMEDVHPGPQFDI